VLAGQSAIGIATFPLGFNGAFANGEKAIRTFFGNYCVRCHGEERQKGDMRLNQLDYGITDHTSVPAWQDVLDVLNTGDMPPEKEKQPGAEELTTAIGAITDNVTTPLVNVWLTLLQQVGVPIEQFSHSTGTLGELLT